MERMIFIDCAAEENEIASNMYQQSEGTGCFIIILWSMRNWFLVATWRDI